MPTAPADMSALEPATAVADLSDRISGILHAAKSNQRGLMRVQVPIVAPDPATWLMSQHPGDRLYWSDRDRGFTMAGVGTALTLHLSDPDKPRAFFDHARTLLSDCSPDIRLYGGFRFDNNRPVSPQWRQFAFGQFILPRFELVARDGSANLAANLVLPDDHDRIDDILHHLAGLDRKSVV